MASKGNSGSRNSGRKPADIARAAVQVLAELTGRQPENVSGLRKEDDGWKVSVEMLELSRVPNSTDVLGQYLVSVDENGELVSYERVRRYQRGQAGEDER